MPEKTIVKLIATLVIFILLIVFAIQNFHRECSVELLFWQTGRLPISIIIFVSILIGVLVAVVELLPHILRVRKRAREAEEELSRLKAVSGSITIRESRDR
jgi:uncharacterized integral membrane protein